MPPGQEDGDCAVRGEDAKTEEEVNNKIMEGFARKDGSPYSRGDVSKQDVYDMVKTLYNCTHQVSKRL